MLGEEILRGLLTRKTEVMTISCTTKQLQRALTTLHAKHGARALPSDTHLRGPALQGHWAESVKPTRRTKWVRNAAMQGLWGRRPGPEASGPSRSKFSSGKPQGTVTHSSTQPVSGEQPGAVPGADRIAGKQTDQIPPQAAQVLTESKDKQDT